MLAPDRKDIADLLVRTVLAAGAAIAAVSKDPADGGLTSSGLKADGTPVTKADWVAHRLITDRIRRFAPAIPPAIPVVSEEDTATHQKGHDASSRFFLIDPLDGTKEYIAGLPEFTVNLAWIEKQRPTLGAVYAPSLSALFFTDASGQAFTAAIAPATAGTITSVPMLFDGAECRSLPLRKTADTKGGITALVSRSHPDQKTEDWLKRRGITNKQAMGSSLKLCRLAEGGAFLYPRLAPIREWDLAAGEAVLLAAGGAVSDFSGAPLVYGKAGFRHESFLAAAPGLNHETFL